MPTVLISGGSSGIGKAAVEYFAAKGWQVFELSRSGQSTEQVRHFDCDVTDLSSATNAVDELLKCTDVIDVVISNAGFGISGTVEFTPLDDVHQQFDVNFFGALNVVKAILPQLRSQRHGRIIFTSSVAAVLSIPYQSFYSATKAAVNAMALALQNEVRDFGIYVGVLMPGDVATGFTRARVRNEVGHDIYPHIHEAVAVMERDEQAGMPPLKMAKALYHIATVSCPAPQYVGGFQYKVFCLLDRILPKRLVNYIVGRLY